MRTKTGITVQDAHELEVFLERLEKRQITTPELKSILMILRQYSHSRVLIEWADSVAHRKRDKGDTFKSGENLWLERFQIHAYFSRRPDWKRIPIPIFELMIDAIGDSNLDLGETFRVDLRKIYPDGYTRKEILSSLKHMYRRSKESHSYELISADDVNRDDLQFLISAIPRLECIYWGDRPPFQFDRIRYDLAADFQRLIKRGKATINKCRDILALHFLCAFHTTEVKVENQKMRCFLGVHAVSGYLSLNLALYHDECGSLKAIEIADETKDYSTGQPNLTYSRPFVVTRLEKSKYMEPIGDEEFDCPLFPKALCVKGGRIVRCKT